MPELKAIFTADAEPFRKELLAAQKMAENTGQNIQESLSFKGIGRGAIREVIVILRELGRGNFTRVPGSIALLVQYLNLSKTAILGLVAAASRITIVGTLAYAAARGIRMLADGAESANKSIVNLTARFEAHNRAMREATQRQQEFQSWLTKLKDKHESIADTTSDQLKILKEEFDLRQKLAKETGQTPIQAAKDEISQAQKELDILVAAKLRSEDVAAKSVGDAAKAEKNFPIKRTEDLKVAEDSANDTAKILAEVMEQFGKQSSGSGIRAAWKSNTLPQLFSSFKAPENRLVNIEGKGSLTLAEARANYEAAEKQAVATSATVKHAEEEISRTREAATKAEEDRQKLTREAGQKYQELQLKQQYLPEIAARQGRINTGHITDLQRVGAFISPGQVTMLDATKKIEKNTAATVAEISSLANSIAAVVLNSGVSPRGDVTMQEVKF